MQAACNQTGINVSSKEQGLQKLQVFAKGGSVGAPRGWDALNRARGAPGSFDLANRRSSKRRGKLQLPGPCPAQQVSGAAQLGVGNKQQAA